MRLPLLPRPVRVAAAVAVAAAVLAASVVPPGDAVARLGPLGLVGLDKWLHAGAYGGLAVAVAYALAARSPRQAAAAVAVAAAFGLAVEAVQFGLPYRSFALADAAANAAGAGLAAAGWHLGGVGRRLAIRTGAEGT